MVDVFVIFTTYWIGAVYPDEFNAGKTYCYGVKIGSVYLIVFMLISNTKLPKIGNWNVDRTLSFMRHYSLFFLIVAALCFKIFQEKILFVFVVTGAVLISVYRNKIFPQMMREEKFSSCVEVVEKFEKVFRLTLFPLFVNVVFRQKALNNYSIWVTLFFLSVMLVAILVFFVDTAKNPNHHKNH